MAAGDSPFVPLKSAIMNCPSCKKMIRTLLYTGQTTVHCPYCKAEITIQIMTSPDRVNYKIGKRNEQKKISKDEAYTIMREAMEQADIVDFFFVGVNLDDEGINMFCWGNDRTQKANAVRYNRLLGEVEEIKFQMMMAARGMLGDQGEAQTGEPAGIDPD
jgi:uncharacterized Zn finger protein (UPF0148 family)